MSTATAAANKSLFMQFHNAMNSCDIEVIEKTIDEFIAPDVIIGTPLPVPSTGSQAFKDVWNILLRTYPDIHLTVEDLIAEGDKVVGRTVVTGTQQGEFMGHAPTGNRVTYNEIFILRVADGQITEVWGVVDIFAQMRQVGVISL
jgi:hypothetical protein